MKFSAIISFAVLLSTLSLQAQSLALGPDEFVASRNLTCVLAQESLGYLTDEEYAQLTQDVLDGYDQEESDVIYAKALGYYDGLMFGLPASDESVIGERLQEFVESQACTMVTGFEGVNLTL